MIKQVVRENKFAIIFLLVCYCTAGKEVSGQTGVADTEENIRASENGILLGHVTEGSELEILVSRDSWLQIHLEGWVWEPSLQVVDRGEFDLAVSAPEGENIRKDPQGSIIGRLENGTLLKSIEKLSGWVRVERKVWIWAKSVDVQTIESQLEIGSAGMAKRGAEWITLGEKDLPVLNVPNGDTLLTALPHSIFEVLARQGNWAQVSISGWLWAPEISEDVLDLPVLADLGIENLSERSDELEGRVLQWDLQFISIERANGIRSDFRENEPYMLTRLANTEDVFVYVTVSLGVLREVSLLNPMEEIRVVGRLRTVSEQLTQAPILELISLEKVEP